MNGVRLGFGVAALLSVAAPVAAQDVSVRLQVGDGPLWIDGYYSSRPRYVVPARYYCEADGPFLYCWDERAYLFEHPVVYVYPADPRYVVLERRSRRVHRDDRWSRDDDDRSWRDDDRRWRQDAKHWRKEARRAHKHWRTAHRYPDGDVRVVFAWER